MQNLDLGVIGMAVMGRNLALNLAEHGYKCAVFNRSKGPLELAKAEDETGLLQPFEKLEDFVSSLSRPRKIILMIKSGDPVDSLISQLIPLLSAGDIIADCGNSYYKDTERRAQELAALDLNYLGVGVSGGEVGARFGPAIMPGGDLAAYEHFADILKDISAKAAGEPCSAYIGKGGSGHYVKMVHNGIEYADMQIIAEGYYFLRYGLGLSLEEIHDCFEKYNQGPLDSYLIEITAKILTAKDDLASGFLLDQIVDEARQKGTGRWTNLEAIELAVDCSVLLAGLNGRNISSMSAERQAANKLYGGARKLELTPKEKQSLISQVERAILAAKIIAYAQGFALYHRASEVYDWQLNLANIAAIFRNGCIIRAKLLKEIMAAFKQEPHCPNLLLSEEFKETVEENIKGLRKIVKLAAEIGIAMPAAFAALSYFDSYKSVPSAANLIQAQRDYFGAHSFERRDRKGNFHYPWQSLEK
ncbi:MAG: NADP-dependent phosphogluconate dehydrogenase [Eubacteriales bacterium]|nr:NADP-dependent phosphogluconate dehydrogenase [Eubacteriales bacterium]